MKNNNKVIPSATVIEVSKLSLHSRPEMNWWLQTHFQILFQSLFALFVVFRARQKLNFENNTFNGAYRKKLCQNIQH